MNKNKSFHVLTILACLIILGSCKQPPQTEQKIDRYALVSKHNITINAFDSLSSLSVGNGSFAFTVDATGLQTFPSVYKNGVCLGTMSDWGWHSFPNTEDFKLDETYKYYEVEGRKIPYSVQWDEGRKKEAANYFRVNPHRLHLGIVGLDLTHSDGALITPEEITEINQNLNLWEGVITSSFEVDKKQMNVQTCCHPQKDLVGIRIQSENIRKGNTGIKIRFPYPTGNHVDDGCDWTNSEKHYSEILEKKSNSAILKHTIDTTTYFVKVNWTGKANLIEKEAHYFVLKPAKENTSFSASVEFSKTQNFTEDIDFDAIKNYSANQWKNFWGSGGAVDLSGTDDPRARELERRVVLSQYLTRIQCAGDLPPQETGLTFNSWYGKFHMEMHWWHSAHWTLWSRNEILQKSMDYYNHIFQVAKHKAEIQGYHGVRWPKMTDPSGGDSPSGVGEFLIWQQPHIIYFAEQCYREHPTQETLDKYAELVFATADFMANFARYDEKKDKYILGPPLIPAQESLEKEKTVNPPFEIAYWHWGLSIAQQWRERLQMEKNKKWQMVINKLPLFAQKNGLYLAAESAPDSYTNEHYFSDHPMVLGAFGIMPQTVDLDTVLMAKTFDHINKIWNWPSTWGWDYPMAAMCATRLEKPEEAVNLLLKDVLKNTYLVNGHNYQGTRLRIYLPGNGGLLTAIAMMCAGYDGNKKTNPGFPPDWKVKWENLEPVF